MEPQGREPPSESPGDPHRGPQRRHRSGRPGGNIPLPREKRDVKLHFKVLDSLRIGPENHKRKIRIGVIENGNVRILLMFACSYGAIFDGNANVKIVK
jgi:hypothetical protein